MPGVSTKAPPEPMKPLTNPPMKPTRNRKAMFSGVRAMNLLASRRSVSISYPPCVR
jgi:hypothetical protein